MNAEELMKQSYPTIEFEDKWDYLPQRFSADDMIHFAKLYAKMKANGIERSSDKCHIQNVSGLLFDFWVHIRGGMNDTHKEEVEQGIADFLANYNR